MMDGNGIRKVFQVHTVCFCNGKIIYFLELLGKYRTYENVITTLLWMCLLMKDVQKSPVMSLVCHLCDSWILVKYS